MDTKDAIKMSKIKVSNELKIAVLEKKVAKLEKVIDSNYFTTSYILNQIS